VKNEDRYRDAERRLWASVGVTPTERRVHLDHIGVSVRLQEAGDGPAVVFVHGASNSGVSWAPLVARMPGFRCVLLDRPGCGLSDPIDVEFRDVETLERFAHALVVDVLDALGLEGAHVVSTSYGGYLAVRAAAAHPDRVHRVVEFGWLLGAPSGRFPLIMRMARVPGLGRLGAAIPPNERAVRALFRRIGLRQALDGGRISQEVIDCYRALLRDTPTMRNEIKTSALLLSPDGRVDGRPLLPAGVLGDIATPMFFLWGEEDPFGGPDAAREFVAQLPNAELEFLPGAGHAVWIDDPDHVATATTQFLARGLS